MSTSKILGDQNVIPYRKAFNRITGGVIPSLLLQQIMYWGRNDGEFYKFIKPCDHPLYNPGDSWIEELGISEYQFSAALKILMNKLKVVKRRRGYGNQYFFKLDRKNLDTLLDQVYKEEEEEVVKNNILRLKKFKNSSVAHSDGNFERFYSVDREEEKVVEDAEAQNSKVTISDKNSEIKKPQKRNQETPSLGMEKLHLSYTETTTETTTETSSISCPKKGQDNGYKTSEKYLLHREILLHLNEIAGKAYKFSKASMTPINARITDGFTLDDFKFVIENKVGQWNNEPKQGENDMRRYLRPSTLFGSKFEEYFNEPDNRRNKATTSSDLRDKIKDANSKIQEYNQLDSDQFRMKMVSLSYEEAAYLLLTKKLNMSWHSFFFENNEEASKILVDVAKELNLDPSSSNKESPIDCKVIQSP